MAPKIKVSARIRRRSPRAACRVVLALLLGGTVVPTHAEPSAPTAALRDGLFLRSLKQPANIPLALDYAAACIALNDNEAAIGALERVAFYAPDDANVKAQLGFLYYQLHSQQMARQYFDAALAGPGLDPATRARIAAIGATVDTANTGHHLFGSLGGGLRYQSNAAFYPDNNILRLSGQDYLFAHPGERGADGNVFGIAQVGFDQDLGNQHGDTLEARLTGYQTRQFRFTSLDVGLYDASVGVRFPLAPSFLPDSSVKLYAVGGQTFLAGQRYLASGGGGVVADFAVRPGAVVEPGIEVRRIAFSNVSVFSSLNSGEAVTAALAGHAALNDHLDLSARAFVTRDIASAAYQTSTTIAGEVALVAHFASPLPFLQPAWSASPYVKLLQTHFDGANPYIDPATTRRDTEVQFGLVLDTPLTATIDLVTSIGDARIASNIPNDRLHNFSVLSGPTVRF